MNCEKEEKE